MPDRLRPGRGRNLTDPLKARTPDGKGRLLAGPRARAHRTATGRDRPSPATPRALPSPSLMAVSRGKKGLRVFLGKLASKVRGEPGRTEPAQVLVEVAEFRGEHERQDS